MEKLVNTLSLYCLLSSERPLEMDSLEITRISQSVIDRSRQGELLRCRCVVAVLFWLFSYQYTLYSTNSLRLVKA